MQCCSYLTAPLLSGNYFTLFSILVNVFSMNKKQISNNNNDQVLDGYVIKLSRLIVELHILVYKTYGGISKEATIECT